ncbi:hypothetical protein EJB05_12346, partial [Eragrostis curvula]
MASPSTPATEAATESSPSSRRRRVDTEVPERIFRACGTPPCPAEARASEYLRFDAMALEDSEEFLKKFLYTNENNHSNGNPHTQPKAPLPRGSTWP